MGAGLLLVLFFFSRSLFGLAGGLVSFLAAVLSPNLAAHSGLATTDVPCAFMVLVSLWCLLLYFNRETIPSLLIVSLTIGIAQLTKNTALILIPLGLGGLIFNEVRRYLRIKDGLGRLTFRLAARTALFCCILLICINAGYGFHRTMEPLSRYRKAVQENMDIRPATFGVAAKIVRPFLSAPVPLPYVLLRPS
jgi:4-amino-4-deoxy-L-arabinose transferase-like glycosyltransferase